MVEALLALKDSSSPILYTRRALGWSQNPRSHSLWGTSHYLGGPQLSACMYTSPAPIPTAMVPMPPPLGSLPKQVRLPISANALLKCSSLSVLTPEAGVLCSF